MAKMANENESMINNYRNDNTQSEYRFRRTEYERFQVQNYRNQ